MYRNTYVEINVDKIKSNIKTIIRKYNYKYYIGVVKGNAYGHGAYIATCMVESGINYLAVSNLDEALEIREYVDIDIPILCLQPIDVKDAKMCLINNITITISSYDYFKHLIKQNDLKGLKVHLKLDTGMNRLGINNKRDLDKMYDYFINNDMISLEGLYTHLATTGISDNRWDKQIEKFKLLTSNIDLSKIPIIHIGSSNTLVYHPKIDFCNGIRLGIIMYGVGPRPLNNNGIMNKMRRLKRTLTRSIFHISKVDESFTLDLQTGFSFISEVSEIKKVNKGEYVGYGNKYLTNEDTKIAVIPVGYADGLSLKNSGRDVVINNHNYPIVGTVNMGMITVQVDDKVKVKDKVVVIGDNVRYISNYIKTTPHQLFSSIVKSVPRVYIEKGKNRII